MLIYGSFHYALGKCFLKDLVWTGFGCVNGFSLRLSLSSQAAQAVQGFEISTLLCAHFPGWTKAILICRRYHRK